MQETIFYRLPDLIENGDDWPKFVGSLPRQNIGCCNWEQEYPYKPKVSFATGWNPSGFFLDYCVHEQQLRAMNTDNNSAVWEDSCVEFFFQFQPGARHYSFEFNPIGAFLGQINFINYGEWIEPADLAKIKVRGSFVNPDGSIEPLLIDRVTDWKLSVFIPFELLTLAEAQMIIRGLKFFVNFFKCGDKTEQPHFISWSPITWPQPSFHRPQFFGTAKLA
ncbi:MAG: carbohydrate-binding family 9-like protein [Negativicutes bacterium]